jgi:hypothetical protein
LPHREVAKAEIIPCVFVFRLDLYRAFQQLNRQRKIAALHGGARAFVQVVGLHVRRRRQRSGRAILHG